MCPSDILHPAASAHRTDTDVNIPYGFYKFRHGQVYISFTKTLVPLKGKYQFQVFAFASVVQEPIIADFLESSRKHMHQTAADEFCIFQGDCPARFPGLFSPGGEDNTLFVHG